MFFRTSGKSCDTSLPSVMAMIVFCMASFLSYAYCDLKNLVRLCMPEHVDPSAYTSPALSSKVSPFRGGANALLIRFIAMIRGYMWITAGRVNRRWKGSVAVIDERSYRQVEGCANAMYFADGDGVLLRASRVCNHSNAEDCVSNSLMLLRPAGAPRSRQDSSARSCL